MSMKVGQGKGMGTKMKYAPGVKNLAQPLLVFVLLLTTTTTTAAAAAAATSV